MLYLVIQAVIRDVQLAADEPLGVGPVSVENLIPSLEPVQLTGEALPGSLKVLFGFLVNRRIAHVGP